MKKCEKCGANLFTIKIKDCDTCEYNGIWDAEECEYIYDIKKEGERTQASEEGECQMGDNYDAGCYYFTCIKCGHSDILPLISE